jgi:hypothetical protein
MIRNRARKTAVSLLEDKSHYVPERICVRSRMDANVTSPYVKGKEQRFGSIDPLEKEPTSIRLQTKGS